MVGTDTAFATPKHTDHLLVHAKGTRYLPIGKAGKGYCIAQRLYQHPLRQVRAEQLTRPRFRPRIRLRYALGGATISVEGSGQEIGSRLHCTAQHMAFLERVNN